MNNGKRDLYDRRIFKRTEGTYKFSGKKMCLEPFERHFSDTRYREIRNCGIIKTRRARVVSVSEKRVVSETEWFSSYLFS